MDSPRRVDLGLALAGESLRAIEQVAEVAAHQGTAVYLVGGVPRDLLLGVAPGPDIDIVVEGDAEALAQQVAARHGGEVRAHRRFGTAKWIRPSLTIDLVSARSEHYVAPTALPTVQLGSLRSDLQRRDFTINTIAIDLHPERVGQVVDTFGGLADLNSRRIRVLHERSFIDDPTRILRALRLAQRLGFTLGPRTAELIPEAVGLLRHLSGQRLLAELLQLGNEPDPQATLEALATHGVLEAIEPGLLPGRRTGALLDALPAAWAFWQRLPQGASLAAQPAAEHRLVLWLLEQEPTVAVRTARRLCVAGRWLRLVEAVLYVRHRCDLLAKAQASASGIWAALHAVAPEAILLAWLSSSEPLRRRHLLRYGAELVAIQPLIRAADLAALGIPAGPLYRTILERVRAARLDGLVLSREEELALAVRIAAEGRPEELNRP